MEGFQQASDMVAKRPLAAKRMQSRRENFMWGLKDQTAPGRGLQGKWLPQVAEEE